MTLRVLAVGNAVLAQVPGLHVLVVTTVSRPARAAGFPRPGRSHRATDWPCHVGAPAGAGACAELEQPRLRAGVGLELQRVVVLPGDVDASGHAA